MGLGKGIGAGKQPGGYEDAHVQHDGSEPDRLLKPAEVAALLGMRLSTVYGWAYQRRLATVKLGRTLRFRLSEVERFVRQNERRARRATNDDER